MTRLYLSGPMSGIEGFNFPAFADASERLRRAGHVVVDPAERGIVPGWEWEDYLRVDLRDLLDCEAVALLPGWEMSRGSNFEVYVARQLGMVCRPVEDFVEDGESPSN